MEERQEIPALIDYLEQCRALVRSGRASRFVLGNEAADLDSMSSAVAAGVYLTRAGLDGDEPFIPLVNAPRADFELRTEAVFLFSALGIRPEHLNFIDEVDLEALHEDGQLKLVLVDHNVLAATQAGLNDAVVGVIDHHKDEGQFQTAALRIVAPVGSAATLVAELLLEDASAGIEPALAELLLGTVLLDTVNLDREAGRGTPRDAEMVERLGEICGADRERLFERLQFEKFNVASLSTPDLLRKDYKEYTLGSLRLGIASVLLPVSQWLEKDPDIESGFAEFARRRKLDVLLAMNAWTDPEFHRELVAWASNEELQSSLLEFLLAQDLGLEPITGAGTATSGTLAFFSQSNVACSRKKLQPILQHFAP